MCSCAWIHVGSGPSSPLSTTDLQWLTHEGYPRYLRNESSSCTYGVWTFRNPAGIPGTQLGHAGFGKSGTAP